MSCTLYVDNYDGCFMSGSEIRGQVGCVFLSSTKVRAIKIRLECREYNSWDGTEYYTDLYDNRRKSRFITLEGDRYPFYHEENLYSPNGSMPAGKYVYPFKIFLPHDIPSSFEGEYGFISYTLKAIVDIPWAVDYTDSGSFEVQSPIDLNTQWPNHEEPVVCTNSKTVCCCLCCCCGGGEVTMDVELDKTGFIPGETVEIRVTVENKSTRRVNNLKVELTKEYTYWVNDPDTESRTETVTVAEMTDKGVTNRTSEVYRLDFEIPEDTYVANFTRCDYFDVSYNLRVSCVMPCCTRNLNIDIDVEMGHIQYTGANKPKDPFSVRDIIKAGKIEREEMKPKERPPPPSFSQASSQPGGPPPKWGAGAPANKPKGGAPSGW